MDLTQKLKDLVEIAREYLETIDDFLNLLKLNRVEEVYKKIFILNEKGARIKETQQELIIFCEKKYGVKIEDFSKFIDTVLSTQSVLKELNKELIELLKEAQRKIELLIKELTLRKDEVGAELQKLSTNREVLDAYSIPRQRNIFDKKG